VQGDGASITNNETSWKIMHFQNCDKTNNS